MVYTNPQFNLIGLLPELIRRKTMAEIVTWTVASVKKRDTSGGYDVTYRRTVIDSNTKEVLREDNFHKVYYDSEGFSQIQGQLATEVANLKALIADEDAKLLALQAELNAAINTIEGT
jgi:RAB protein geranylgeranyltransferase component A